MAWVTLIESDTETMQPLRPAKGLKKSIEVGMRSKYVRIYL